MFSHSQVHDIVKVSRKPNLFLLLGIATISISALLLGITRISVLALHYYVFSNGY